MPERAKHRNGIAMSDSKGAEKGTGYFIHSL